MESRYVEDGVQGSLVSQHRLLLFSERDLRWNGRMIKLRKSDEAKVAVLGVKDRDALAAALRLWWQSHVSLAG